MNILDIISVIAIVVFTLVLCAIIWHTIKSVIIDISNLKLSLHKNKMEKETGEIQLRKKSNDLFYVSPDQRGVLPLPRHILEEFDMMEWIKAQYASMFQAGSGQGSSSVPSTQGGTIKTSEKPNDLFTLWANNQLPSDKFLLGYNVADNLPVYVTFNDLRSTLVGGQTDSGKSTLVRSILIQAIMQGAKIALIDPHADAGEESLADSFYPMSDRMYLPIAKTVEEQLNTISAIKNELQNRINGASHDKTPIVLVVDETNALLTDPNISRPLEELLSKISNEARKVHIYALCIGQNFHSSNMPTTVRNSFVSIFSTYSRRDVARVLSGDTEFSHLAEELKIGQAVWAKRGIINVLNIPNVTSTQVLLIAQSLLLKNKKDEERGYTNGEYIKKPSVKDSERSPLPEYYDEPLQTPLPKIVNPYKESSGHVVDSSGKNYVDVVDLDEDKMRKIVQMMIQGKTSTEIITTIFHVDRRGNAFQQAAIEYRKYLAKIAERSIGHV